MDRPHWDQHPGARANKGYVPDRALEEYHQPIQAKHTVDMRCSCCGDPVGRVFIEASSVVNSTLVQATRWCTQNCAIDYCTAALAANGFALHTDAVIERIVNAFREAEEEYDDDIDVVIVTQPQRNDDNDTVIPLINQYFDDLPPFVPFIQENPTSSDPIRPVEMAAAPEYFEDEQVFQQ